MAFPLEPQYRRRSPRAAKVLLPVTLGVTLLIFGVRRAGQSSYLALGRARRLFWGKRLLLVLLPWWTLLVVGFHLMPPPALGPNAAFRAYRWCAEGVWRCGNLALFLLDRLLPTDGAQEGWSRIVADSIGTFAAREVNVVLLLPALLPLALLWLVFYGAAFLRYLVAGPPHA